VRTSGLTPSQPPCGVERTRAVALIDPLSGTKQQAGLAGGR
jgi:hypothetical protein